MPSKLAITSGPSIHQENLHNMIEEGLGFNFIYALHNTDQSKLKELVDMADIFIGGGGRDVFPITYGRTLEKGENMDKFDLKRDLREVFLIEEFIRQNKPVVGVCRSLQLFCSRFLGLYLTDINYPYTTVVHSPTNAGIELKENEEQFTHLINFTDGTENKFVNSYHHMGILNPSPANLQKALNRLESNDILNIRALAETGGLNNKDKNPRIIEWIDGVINGSPFNFVQWHPENIWKENEASQMFLAQIKELVG